MNAELSAKQQEHYFTPNPKSKLVIHKNKFLIKGVNKAIYYYSASGLFSKKRVDIGSELLINKAVIKPRQKVLDLGCGYGIIGISAKTIEPTIKLTFSDINIRAIEITKKNLELNKMEANIIHSDCFARIPDSFDVILLNPPQTSGKEVCFKLVRDSRGHLNRNGSLQIVARHKKGGETLKNYMQETFGNVKETARKSGFRVYYSENKKV